MVRAYECLQLLNEVLDKDALVVKWGGSIGEWSHIRPHPPSLTLALGCATATGLGLALALPHRRVVVLDSDGGILLFLGVLATLGNLRPPNLTVFIRDNECYSSTGTQPTATAGRTDLAGMAKAAGVEHTETARTLDEFKDAAKRAVADKALHFIVMKVEPGVQKMPTSFVDPVEGKYKFVRYIEETENIRTIMPPLQHLDDTEIPPNLSTELKYLEL